MSSQNNKSILDEDDEDRFWQKLILPEDDPRRRLGAPWRGGYRWFRSPNVVPIERYRNKRKKAALNTGD
jgi:hypothetical protein